MAYDAENHQTSFTSGGTTTTYQYDGDGRRVKKLQGARILHHPGRFGPAC